MTETTATSTPGISALIPNRHVLISLIVSQMYKELLPKIDNLLPGLVSCIWLESDPDLDGFKDTDFSIAHMVQWAHDTRTQGLIGINVSDVLGVSCCIAGHPDSKIITPEVTHANHLSAQLVLEYLLGDGWPHITKAINNQLNAVLESASHNTNTEYYAVQCAQYLEDQAS